MCKKAYLRRQTVLFVAFFLFLSLIRLSPLDARTVDAVVMIETSQAMVHYFDEVKDFIVNQYLGEQLRSGDTIHVLSFGEDAEYQISRTIRSGGDVEQVTERIMQLKALDVHSDLVAAFKAIHDYTSDLPLESQKSLIIFSKGIHKPSPLSRYPLSARNSRDIGTLSALMRRNGWNVRIIQIPDHNDGEIQNLLALAARELGSDIVLFEGKDKSFPFRATGQLELRYPEHAGTIKRKFTLKLTAVNHLSFPSSLRFEEVLINGTPTLEREYSAGIKGESEREIRLPLIAPDNLAGGESILDIEIITGEGKRSFPARASVSATVPDTASRGKSVFSLPFVLVFLALPLLLILIIVAVRHSFLATSMEEDPYPASHLPSGPELTVNVKKPAVTGFTTTMYTKKQIAKARHGGKVAMELIVTGQNRKVGKRNIRWMDKGDTLTLGGSNSDHFLIFLYAVPHSIGYLERSESGIITFIPGEQHKFPGTGSEPLHDCLDKTIIYRLNDTIDIEMKFQFWVSPLESMNSFLHITDNSGLPGKDQQKRY